METRTLLHAGEQEIRWGDMDALGHVNNTVFFRYMEQARCEWMHCCMGGHDAGQAVVIVNAYCEYLRPLVYPGKIEVRMYAGKPGRSSLESYYEIRSEGHKCAAGSAKMVWVDTATGRSSAIPERIRALLR